VMIRASGLTERDAAAIRLAQLADMKEEEIVAYLRERGWLVEWPGAVVFARVGYTVSPGARLLAPLADEDVETIPFNGEDRRP
jgi:hypothetical protein